MGEISNSGLPIIFKGNMVLRVAKNDQSISRDTYDIDCDWINEPPSMEQLELKLNNAVKGLNNVRFERCRDYIERPDLHRSAGFNVYVGDDEKPFTSIDISMKKISSYQDYYVGKITFRGYDLDNIVADKVCVVGNNKAPRRPKDLLDLYSIAIGDDININNVYENIESKGRTAGDFERFIHEKEYESENPKSTLRYAYNKLTEVEVNGINTIPDFDEVYLTLKQFLEPFIEDSRDLIWNHETRQWFPECGIDTFRTR